MNIEKKYNRGAKIVLFISLMAIPMQLITSALISRISSEASGALGILEIFYNVIVAFFVLGGETGIIKLLTDRREIKSKKNFISKYIVICIFFFLIVAVGLRLFKFDIIKIVTGQENSTSVLMYIVALFIIINNILLAYIKESEKFIHYAIGIKLFNLGNLLSVLYVSFIGKSADINIILLIVMGMLQLINVTFIIIKEKIFLGITVKKHEKIDYRILKYIFFLYLSTILAFLYDKIDQIIVVNKLGLSILGGYYLIIKVVNMVKLIPNTYNSTFYPYICKQLKKENANFIFNNILSKNLLFIFPMTVLIVLNSDLIITVLFGVVYLKYGLLLQILTGIVLFSAPNVILNNFLYALEKSNKYFWISFISVLVEIMVIYCFIDKTGLVIVPISKCCANLSILILSKISLEKMGYKVKLPFKYYIYNIILIVDLIVTNMIQLSGIIYIILSLIIIGIFALNNRQYLLKILKDITKKIKEKNNEFIE